MHVVVGYEFVLFDVGLLCRGCEGGEEGYGGEEEVFHFWVSMSATA